MERGIVAAVLLAGLVLVCQGHCAYKFLLLEERYGFTDAQVRCQHLGYTDLAILDSHTLIHKAVRYMSSRNSAGTHVWIGIKFTQGHFSYVNRTSRVFENWDRGEPDPSKKCVRMMPDTSYLWASYYCREKFFALCGKEVRRETSARFILHAVDVDTTDQSMKPPVDVQSVEECSTLCLEACPECTYFIHVNATCTLFDDVTLSTHRPGARVFYKTYSE
ncbi:uncharacterized protein [Haliotis cracherodii]|uniref:uncharacterized protein n=1 Tax=Haliotis cracherodii TaxID=6455 RepID=UPI0039ED2F72